MFLPLGLRTRIEISTTAYASESTPIADHIDIAPGLEDTLVALHLLHNDREVASYNAGVAQEVRIIL